MSVFYDQSTSDRIDRAQTKVRPRLPPESIKNLKSNLEKKNCSASTHTPYSFEDMASNLVHSNVDKKQQPEKSSSRKKRPTRQTYQPIIGLHRHKVANSRLSDQAHVSTSNSVSNSIPDIKHCDQNKGAENNLNGRDDCENSASHIAELENSKDNFKDDHLVLLNNKNNISFESCSKDLYSLTITKKINSNNNSLNCNASEVTSQLLSNSDVPSDSSSLSPSKDFPNKCHFTQLSFDDNWAFKQEPTDENYIPPPTACGTSAVFDVKSNSNNHQFSNFGDISENQSILPNKRDLQLHDVAPTGSQEEKQKLQIKTTASSKVGEDCEIQSTLSSEVDDELILEIDEFLHKLEFERSMPNIYAEKILKDLKHFLRYFFKGASAKLYGSYWCDVAITSSDINLGLITDHPIKNNYLLYLQKKLAAEFDEYKVFPFEEESNPRRSKICFVDKKHGISCYLMYLGTTVSQYLELNDMLKAVCNFNHRIKSLIIITRLWAEAVQIDEVEDGKLHPMGFSLLVIHYLQQLEKPLLPLLDVSSRNWGLNKWTVKNNSSVADLWLNFLKYYGCNFNWIENVVTVTSKTPVVKTSKVWPISWIAIEDPVSKKNIAETVLTSDMAERITSCFKKAYDYFISGPYDSDSSSSAESVNDGSQNIRKQSVFKLSDSVSHPPPIFCLDDDDDDDYDDYASPVPQRVTVQEPMKFSKISEESLKCVDQVLKEAYDEYKLPDKQVKGREVFVEELQRYIRRIYPGATLHLFGSTVNGFGFKKSDLDICMTINGKYKNNDNDAHVLRRLTSHLRRKNDLENVFALYSAKIPIIKFNLTTQNWHCDLSFYNVLAVHNSELLHKYSLMDEKCRILGCALKLLAKKTLIADCSLKTLSSYSYILMVIHFLQQVSPPVLPVLPIHDKEEFEKELDAKELDRKGVFRNRNHWFFEDAEKLKKRYLGSERNTSSVGKLWLEMLEYYLKLDYGTAINITEKDRVESESLQRSARLFNIEDPFISKRNLGCIVSEQKAIEIRKIFYRARMLFGSDYLKEMNLMEHYFSPSNLTGRLLKNIECTACGGFAHEVKECLKADPFKNKKPRNPCKNKPNKSNRRISPQL